MLYFYCFKRQYSPSVTTTMNNLLVHAAMIAHAQCDVLYSRLDQIIFSVRAKIYPNKSLFLIIFIYSSGRRTCSIKKVVALQNSCLHPGSCFAAMSNNIYGSQSMKIVSNSKKIANLITETFLSGKNYDVW